MVDIRIMASPKRRDNVMRLLDKLQLSEDIVAWDDRQNGGDAMYTAKKAWMSQLGEEFTHRLVLQDDVDVCNNFVSHVNAIGKQHPENAVTLFQYLYPLNYPNPENSPYYRSNILHGPAIMLPRHIIEPCMRWSDECGNDKIRLHDDLVITDYCRKNRILMVMTVPSIVQHLNISSLLPIEYSWERTSRMYCENPDVNWDSDIVYKAL